MPPILSYNVYKKIPTQEGVEGLRVTAQTWSEDHKVDLTFDCTEALGTLNKKQIYELIIEDFRYCDASDWLADYYSETRTSKMFTYLDMRYNSLGFKVKVNGQQAVAWLQENRAEWLQEWEDDPDIQYNLNNH